MIAPLPVLGKFKFFIGPYRINTKLDFSFFKFLPLLVVFSLQTTAQAPPRHKLDSLLAELSFPKVRNIDDTIKAIILLRIAQQYDKIPIWDSAKLYAQKSLDLSQKIDYFYGQGLCLLYMGDLVGTNFPAGFDYYFRALHAFEKTHNDDWIADALGHIAGLYFNMNNFPEALTYFTKERQRRENSKDVYTRARSTHNIGETYGQMGDYKNALKYELESLNIFEHLDSSKGIAMALNNIGNSYAALRNYNMAMAYLLKSYRLYASFGKDTKYGMVSDDIAYTYYLIATDSVTNIAPDSLIAGTKKENFARALEWFSEANIVFDKIPRSEHTKRYSYALAHAGRYKEAFTWLKNYLEYRDNYWSNGKYLEVSNDQVHREIGLKEKQIELNEIEVANKEKERILFFTIIGLLGLLVILSVRNRRRSKRANETLAFANKELEESIVQKDALTAQISLSADMKTKFFANISHELRTPVTLLTGMLELMKNTVPQVAEANGKNLSTRNTTRLDVAYNNSRRLLYMVEELLDLSRLENSEAKLKKEVKPVTSIIRRMVFAFETLIEKEVLTLEYSEHETAEVHIAADEIFLEKIVNNLMYNAIKFNKPGGWIRVVLSVSPDKQNFILNINNSGNPVKAEDLPFIFDRFYQGKTNSPKADGVGIGLSLVKEFSNLMNGTVRAMSNEHEGTTFILEFPVVAELPIETVSHDELKVLAAEVWQRFPQQQTVLIVEDNVDMRYYLREILADNVKIEEAGNGEEALKWLAQYKADLVITDLMMPEMNGEEFVSRLKENPQYKQIPVITLTALADSTSRLSMLRLGIDDYISKPFDAEELKVKVYNLLCNHAERRAYNNKPVEADEDLPENAKDVQEFKDKVTIFVLGRMKTFNISVYDLAYELAMSERQLYRLAKSLTGYSPAQLIKEVRLQKAYELLAGGTINKVDDVAGQVGFEDANYFSLQFLSRFGKRPADYL